VIVREVSQGIASRFAEREKQEVFPAASMDGFTAIREACSDPRTHVFTVEEYERDGKTQKRWTKIGAAFPHKEGLGFSIELKAFPIDGRLVVLPPDLDDGSSRNGK
jgi:hypothetical protein